MEIIPATIMILQRLLKKWNSSVRFAKKSFTIKKINGACTAASRYQKAQL
jgi:hypothetical protein